MANFSVISFPVNLMWPGSHSFYPVEPKRGHLKRGLGGTIIGDIIIKRIVASVAVAKKKKQ